MQLSQKCTSAKFIRADIFTPETNLSLSRDEAVPGSYSVQAVLTPYTYIYLGHSGSTRPVQLASAQLILNPVGHYSGHSKSDHPGAFREYSADTQTNKTLPRPFRESSSGIQPFRQCSAGVQIIKALLS